MSLQVMMFFTTRPSLCTRPTAKEDLSHTHNASTCGFLALVPTVQLVFLVPSCTLLQIHACFSLSTRLLPPPLITQFVAQPSSFLALTALVLMALEMLEVVLLHQRRVMATMEIQQSGWSAKCEREPHEHKAEQSCQACCCSRQELQS